MALTIGEMMTTTIRRRNRKAADNFTQNNAFNMKLNSKGKIKTFDGGTEIMEEISYRGNDTYKRYTGYDLLNVQPSNTLTAAIYQMRQAAISVTISGREQLQNAGRERMIPLLSSRIDNAFGELTNNIAEDQYSNGSADNGKQIDGLGVAVPSSVMTGTYGGIDRASYTWWRPQYRKPAMGLAAISDKDFKMEWHKLYQSQTRGKDKPDLVLVDDELYTRYNSTLQEQQRYASSKMASAGFQSLKFQMADVIFDGGYGGHAPDRTAFFLNCNHLKWRPHAKRNMVPMEPRNSIDQDAEVRLILFAGNMTCDCQFLQGRFEINA